LDEVARDFAEAFAPAERGPCKLYLVSPPEVSGPFPDRLKAALDPGIATAFQLRIKDMEEHQLARLAEPLQRICADANVAFIVNDSVSLAKRLGADGVHLGQSDGDVREARAVLGPAAQIGKTCHDSRPFAMEAGISPATWAVAKTGRAVQPPAVRRTKFGPALLVPGALALPAAPPRERKIMAVSARPTRTDPCPAHSTSP